MPRHSLAQIGLARNTLAHLRREVPPPGRRTSRVHDETGARLGTHCTGPDKVLAFFSEHRYNRGDRYSTQSHSANPFVCQTVQDDQVATRYGMLELDHAEA